MSSQSKYTSSQEVYISDASLNNIAEIKTTLGAKEVQNFNCDFAFFGDPAGDLQFQFTVPSGATMTGNYAYTRLDSSGSTGESMPITVKNVDFTTPQVLSILAGNTSDQSIHMWGVIEANGTAGDVQMQAAQGTSNANATTIYKDLAFNVFNAN